MILQLLSDDSFVDVQVGNPVPIHRERVAFAGGAAHLECSARKLSMYETERTYREIRRKRHGLYLLSPAPERAHMHECQWASCTLCGTESRCKLRLHMAILRAQLAHRLRSTWSRQHCRW